MKRSGLNKTIAAIAMMLIGWLPSLAHDFEVDGIYYNKINSKVVVTYKGNYYDSYSNEYAGDVVIPSSVNYRGTTFSVTSIDVYAFRECSSLTSIEIGNSVTRIGDWAFHECTSLTSIEIPNSVTSIGDGAFSGCSGLTSIVVDSGNTKYDSRNDCNAIIETASNTLIAGCQNTIIPNSVTSIGKSAFSHCKSLTSIEIPNSVTSIGNYAFDSCSSLTSIEIGNSVTSIGDDAFYGCSSLTSIEIPNSVTSIGYSAFSSCDSLTSIEIPNSVTSIGPAAFWECSSLTSVVIGNSVTSIGYGAFSYCSSLTKITCLATNPPSIYSDTFFSYSAKLYVPTGCKESYEAAEYWNKFTNIIELEPELEEGATFEYEGLTYKVIVKGEELAVIASENGRYSGNIVIPSLVDYNGTTYSVTSIGNYAFSYCTSLTSIEIPNSVTSIGSWAFAWCESLTSVVIGNSVTSIGEWAFAGCSSLTSIQIPNSVTSIGDDAFYGCSNLTSIEIPNSVTGIGNRAFECCSSLTSIVIPNSVTSIGDGAFYGCSSLTSIEIPNSVTRIGDGAFRGCSSLTSVVIGNSVTSIGDGAFYDCSSLTSIEIPNSVTSIGNYAFYGCSSLTSIVIPNSVTSIGDFAFGNCLGLTSIEIPNSVTSIGNYAFSGCSGLTNIVVDSGNTKYDSRNGCNAIIETASNTLIAGCQNTIIPNSVTSIGNGAFRYCRSLTSIEIPNSVTSIGDEAFFWCTSLISIEISNSVTSIGNYAFYGCSSLTEIICLAVTPPAIESDSFSNYSAKLYVPAGCKSAYKSAYYWKNFSNIIEIPEEISFGLAGHTSAISCNPQDDYSFGISWREFAEILYNDYIPFSSVEDFKNVYDTSNLKVIYSYNGRDITQYVGASFDASLNPDNIYAWSFTFYDNIPAEVFPLNVNDATNLDIQVLCTPKQDKESYPILRVNTNLTIGPLGEYLSTMVNLIEAYWLDATTLRILPIQYGSLDAGMTCDYRFPIQQAFWLKDTKSVVFNKSLDCVYWDVVFSNQQSAGYGAANYDLYFNNQIGARLEWNSSSGIHTRFDELCGVADNHEVFVSVYNNAAGKEIIDAKQPVQITFLARYPNGQVVPVESYNLQFVKPLNFSTAEFNGYFIEGALEGQDGYAINTADPFVIVDFRGQSVTKASNNGLYAYYGLEEVVWHVDEARVGITSDGVVLSKDKMLTIDGEINTAVTTIIGQAATADMSLVHNGSQLIYKNTGALNVEKDFYIALYVSVKHKWGEFKAPVIIPVKVVRNINNITLDKSEAYLIVDEQISLKATVLPENATNKSVTWKSSNEAVATVDANGKVTAVSIGEAIITAITNDGSNLSASCKVTVHANYLSGKTVNPYSGASERVSVEMTNEQAITAFQCDIYLPDGISVATIDGEYDINLSSRAKSSHSLSCVEQSDGSIRLLCYSMSLATFSGNEGELFDINFNISKEIEGNYQVLIDNIVLTDKAQNEYKSSAAIIDFNVKAYVPADVNNDGSINVTDVVATASYILGLDTKKFIFEAADMNKDGVINVTDIVGIASIILNGGSASNVSAQRCAPNSSDAIKIEDFAAGKNQSQQVAIEMTNASDYSAFQMDIRLPKGMSIAECELASAATDHMVAYRKLPDGAVRVLVYSLTCRTLPNSEEGIIRLRTTTDNRFEGGEIVVENILFADRGQNEYRLYDSVANVNLATGVSATDVDCVVYAENRSIVIISPCDQQATITSVDGVSRTYSLNEGCNEIAAPQAGVYIVTLADKTFKVIVK